MADPTLQELQSVADKQLSDLQVSISRLSTASAPPSSDPNVMLQAMAHQLAINNKIIATIALAETNWFQGVDMTPYVNQHVPLVNPNLFVTPWPKQGTKLYVINDNAPNEQYYNGDHAVYPHVSLLGRVFMCLVNVNSGNTLAPDDTVLAIFQAMTTLMPAMYTRANGDVVVLGSNPAEDNQVFRSDFVRPNANTAAIIAALGASCCGLDLRDGGAGQLWVRLS